MAKKSKKKQEKSKCQVQWGSLKFIVNKKVVHGIDNFSASLSEKEKDSKCKKKYSEPEKVSFVITTSFTAGGHPLHDYNFLKTYVGNSGKLKVNEGTGVKLANWQAGGAKFKLTSVNLSKTEMDVKGRILAAEIKLDFIETPTKKTGTKKKVTKMRKNIKKKIKGTW